VAHIFIGIGSNFNRDNNIIASINILKKTFGKVTVSHVYESEAVGFKGKNFYNLVAEFHCDLTIDALINKLKEIELHLGRSRKKTDQVVTAIDLDLLLYDQVVDTAYNIPRAEITKNAFVLKPLAELAKNRQHPVLATSYQELWLTYPAHKQKLKEIVLSTSPQ